MSSHQLPNTMARGAMTIRELMKATLRMNEILAIENELLSRMKVGEMAKYREEKVKLTMQLESYQRVMKTDTSFIAQADESSREQLVEMTAELAYALEENLHRTTVARLANQRVLQTITDALSDNQRLGTYGPQGRASQPVTETISLNLNQKA